MGRLKQKGKAGAAKAYVTRSAAIKKLQCSLADFRRLCILKGIFPREPRHRKKANKGSSAPTSFYYAKDIAYLAHEPVLKKLREHKAFAKKLSRALGRGEWSDAKTLEENKPVYKLDHIIKERYPTFIDAVRDIDDALCMIFLFAALPSNTRLPPSIIENCTRLASEWQLYVIQSKSLRKAFLSIKGVYYQAEVLDQTITWLVPYQFTQNVPPDVDVRVMLTFLELYQTLLGFVFFKLYTDIGLVYPPPLDAKKADSAAGVDAFTLQAHPTSSKDVRQAIKAVSGIGEAVTSAEEQDEEFVPQPSKNDAAETSRTVFEFLVRSFGGRIGWPASSGAGSPFDEDDNSITHVIIDRPPRGVTQPATRKYVQPQWVVDCINQGKLLLENDYAPGKTLPPHLSPFGEYEGAYDPTPGPCPDLDASDLDAVRAAELKAEAAGVDYGEWEKQLKKKKEDMNKMLMSNRQKKLYTKMVYSNKQKADERTKLEQRRKDIQKSKKKVTKERS
ncbi:Pescadillo N-terminus-domain-containing protein [Flagelloscypha sp. PMI_526]|nr:Pescadillo N-terminus-domain-containing protein [Flagelloscypha sp. PMI_526]